MSTSRIFRVPNGTYRVRWIAPGSGGKRTGRTFKTVEQAQAHLQGLLERGEIRSLAGDQIRLPAEVRAEIRARVQVTPGGCWLWTGFVYPNGYGQLKWKRNGVADFNAHRVSYRAFKGDIPAGLEIDHLCRVRSCCNPNHLEAVTHRENVIRGHAARKSA